MLIMNFSLTIHDVNFLPQTIFLIGNHHTNCDQWWCLSPHIPLSRSRPVPGSPPALAALARGWGVPVSLRTTPSPPATDAAVKSENILIIGRCYLILQFCLFSVDIVVGGGTGLRHQRLGPHRSYHSYHARHETCETLSTGHAHSEQGTYGSYNSNRKCWLIFSSWPVYIA